MNSLSTAQFFAVCHTCRLRHPCFNHQGYLDFCQRHQNHATSFFNRDWLHETHRSPLAAWDPRKLVRSVFGGLEAWALRQAVGEMWSYAPNADVKQGWRNRQG